MTWANDTGSGTGIPPEYRPITQSIMKSKQKPIAKIVYRKRSSDGRYEIGETMLPIQEINRTGIDGWCDSRICETWDELTALQIVTALQEYLNKES